MDYSGKAKNAVMVFDSEIETPLVTIGIPAYKSGEFLKDAIDSAVRQNFDKPFEILVVNDNPSEDDISGLMNNYEHDPRFAYYKNEKNLGPTGNWGNMYALAKGKYVVMLQDDDLLFPYYLQVVFGFLEVTEYKYDLVYIKQYISTERQLPPVSIPKSVRYNVMKLQDYVVNQPGLPTGLFIDKEKYHLSGGYTNDLFPVNDEEFLYRALHYMNGCRILNPMALYYVGNNLSLKPEIFFEGIRKSKEFNRLMRKDKQNIWRWVACLCYRHQIKNLMQWNEKFVTEEMMEQARKNIDLPKSWMKDRFSDVIAKFFSQYIYRVRYKSVEL